MMPSNNVADPTLIARPLKGDIILRNEQLWKRLP